MWYYVKLSIFLVLMFQFIIWSNARMAEGASAKVNPVPQPRFTKQVVDNSRDDTWSSKVIYLIKDNSTGAEYLQTIVSKYNNQGGCAVSTIKLDPKKK